MTAKVYKIGKVAKVLDVIEREKAARPLNTGRDILHSHSGAYHLSRMMPPIGDC